MNPHGVDVEIYEPIQPGDAEIGVIKPYFIKINGVDVLTTTEPTVLSDISRRNAFTMKVELFVRSLKVHAVPTEPKRSAPRPAIVFAHEDNQTGDLVTLDFYTPTEAIGWLEDKLRFAREYQASDHGKLLEAARLERH